MSNNKATYKISELPSTTDYLNGNEMIEISKPILNNGYESKKISLNSSGSWLGNNLAIPQLENTSVINAINSLRRTGDNAGAHNAIYRGQYLGTAPTEAQYQAIFNGTFEDLYIGDFWSEDPNDASKPRWRIAGFNYYSGSGLNTPVLTNHAVIIPDVAIVTNNGKIVNSEGYDSLGGYKYSYARGYKSATSYTTTTVDNQLSFPVNYIPAYISYVKTNFSIPPSDGINFLWEVDAEHTGEDPNNPGHGIITIYGGNRYTIFGGTASSVPVYDGIPSGSYVEFSYKYYEENYGPLAEAKTIINNVFGSNHIMHHEIPLSVQKIFGAKQGLFIGGNSYIKQWEDVTVEVPTSECIYGNTDMSAYNEYYPNTMSKQQYFANLYNFNTNFTQYNPSNPPYNALEAHLEFSQLPLFNYDPALIHTRYGYWLRNLGTNMEIKSNSSGAMFAWDYQVRYLAVDPMGAQLRYPTESYSNVGIRPMFCISATSEPNVLPTNIL